VYLSKEKKMGKLRTKYSNLSLFQLLFLFFLAGEEKYLFLFCIIKYVSFIHFMKKNNNKKNKNTFLSLFVNLESVAAWEASPTERKYEGGKGLAPSGGEVSLGYRSRISFHSLNPN
jgi:hypothetical protein